MEDRPDLGYTQPQPPPDEMFTRRTHRPPVPETGARSRPRLTLQSALVGVVAGGIIISAVGCLLAASAYTYYQARGTILPGVGVGDLSLDGMTYEEAAAALDERFNQQAETKRCEVFSSASRRAFTPLPRIHVAGGVP